MVSSLSKNDGTFDSKPDEAWGAVNLLEKNLDHLVDKYKLNKKISVYWDSVKDQYSAGHLLTVEQIQRRIVALSGFIHESIDTSSKPIFSLRCTWYDRYGYTNF